MKKALLLFALSFGLSAPMSAQSAPPNVLTHIQSRLAHTVPLDSLLMLESELGKVRTATPNAYLSYWQAYVNYRLSYAYGKDRKSADKAADKGVSLLEGIKTKSSEHYSLLSLLQGILLETASPVTVAFKATTVGSSARKSIELDANNLRAYLALAVYDFYTPKLYGGGKLVEENLKKAIALSPKSDANAYAPDWGQATAYRYLAKFYQNDNKLDLAKQYAMAGMSKYPMNRGLQELSKNL